MSNIDKPALREEFKMMQECYSDPADRDRQVIYLAAEALLDELEAKDKLNAELMEKQRLIDICQGQGLEHRIAAEKRAEAAEKRIAELEAREVKLPKTISVLHRRDFMDAHRSIYAYPEAEVNAALADAGINIAAAGKGE
ncbi:ead/Ea22-like family protein [Enterobacter asburiae]|uniref:ead/Ea22-like family protein n=1 Tax=Enterobacter asburiae TaxID=61645 RepID=UPI002A8264B7|nr:ead/Ea22-like family protein [Enterobacter asburiae]